MAAITREQTAKYLYDAGFRGDDLARMVAIAGRESSYNPEAHRTDQPKSKLSGDMGLFQINYVNWPKVSQALGLTDKSQLFDPAINAKAAKILHDSSGYSSWTADKGGWSANGDPMYGTDYAAAKEATQNFLNNPSAYGGSSAGEPRTVADVTSNTGVNAMTTSEQRQVYKVAGGPGGEGSFSAYVRYPDGRLQHINGEQWAGLTSTIQPTEVSAEEFANVIKGSIPEGDAPAGYLGGSETVWNEQRNKTTATTRNWKPPEYVPPTRDPAAQGTLTSLVSGFGIDYPDGPRATPQLLAWMRGLGMTKDVLEDSYSDTVSSLQRAATDSRGDLFRQDTRQREGIANDAVGRGALVSGATNTGFARQAENYAAGVSDIERKLAEGTEQADTARKSGLDTLRQGALERLLTEDEQQQSADAVNKQKADDLKRAMEEDDFQYNRERTERERANAAAIGRYTLTGR